MDGQFPSGGGGGMGGQAAAEEDYSKLSLEDRLSSKVSTGKSEMTICYCANCLGLEGASQRLRRNDQGV
jgi:hypothetical protein